MEPRKVLKLWALTPHVTPGNSFALFEPQPSLYTWRDPQRVILETFIHAAAYLGDLDSEASEVSLPLGQQ